MHEFLEVLLLVSRSQLDIVFRISHLKNFVFFFKRKGRICMDVCILYARQLAGKHGRAKSTGCIAGNVFRIKC